MAVAALVVVDDFNSHSICNNVVNPIINILFGDGLYNPFIVFFGDGTPLGLPH
jgi:hypothetical protein